MIVVVVVFVVSDDDRSGPCGLTRGDLYRPIISAFPCIDHQTLLLTHFELLCQDECLSINMLFPACFHAWLCGHEKIAAYPLSDVLGTVVLRGQGVLERGT
jgi:hypothetical protein